MPHLSQSSSLQAGSSDNAKVRIPPTPPGIYESRKEIVQMTERNERLYNPEPPGAGAIEFACAIVAGMDEDRAAATINAIVERSYHDPDDPRIKDCRFCGFVYRDKTRPNNSKTCSPECKAGMDAEKKREKRNAAGQFHEYRASNYESLHPNDKLEYIEAARQRYNTIGGRKGRRNAEEWRERDY